MEDRSHEHTLESTVQGAVKPQLGEVRIRTRGRLPHWEREEGLYFITFHLVDSLPQRALDEMVERNKILKAAKCLGVHLTPAQEELIAKYSQVRIEAYFDRGAGECVLKDQRIAEAMAATLRYWHGKRYRLVAWCIMPNHVHIICRFLTGQKLSDVVKGWKVHSAREANRILRRSGPMWRREYCDRLIRGEGEFNRAIRYVLSNPERAGLKNWKWVWSEGLEALDTAGQETGGT
jgi:REP element-mobilizing transposase RayT